MDDDQLARKLRRVPSIAPVHLRGAVKIFEATRENPPMPTADELAALDLVAQRAAEAAAAINALGWDGSEGLEGALPIGQNLSDTCRQLAAIEGAALAARKQLGEACRSGRPVSNLTQLAMMLADLIEGGGGVADAKQGGELCQAFGVAVELLGLSRSKHRDIVRAALGRRNARQ
ncbi:MAG: hypothetical protein NXH88_04645 [Hyphomonas sp.]|nr:hypothetical protein [Hyphomonas sp.]